MGYHYVIDRFECPSQAQPGDTLECRLAIDNVGVAPIYKKLPLKVRLTDGAREYLYDSGIDITAWMPGKSNEVLEIALNHAAPGTYDIEIGIISPHALVVYFATDAEQDGAYYKVGKIVIT